MCQLPASCKLFYCEACGRVLKSAAMPEWELPETEADYYRSLSVNHPLNRRQFFIDVRDKLKQIGAGAVTGAGGLWWMDWADQKWDENTIRLCEMRYQKPDCKEADPQLYQGIKDSMEDPYLLIQLPGCLGLFSGGLVAATGAATLAALIIKRRIQLMRR